MHQIFTPSLTPFWCQQTKPDENRQNVIFYDERKYVEIKIFMKPDEARQKSISTKKLMEILKNRILIYKYHQTLQTLKPLGFRC